MKGSKDNEELVMNPPDVRRETESYSSSNTYNKEFNSCYSTFIFHFEVIDCVSKSFVQNKLLIIELYLVFHNKKIIDPRTELKIFVWTTKLVLGVFCAIFRRKNTTF